MADHEKELTMRLDAFVTENFGITRSRAKALITSGAVAVFGKVVTKPAYPADGINVCDVTVAEDTIPYVSRGGLKLEGALELFGVDPSDRVCIDVGASTGGFTDCLLRRGAKLVYAIDSGSDQLAPILRENLKVISVEGFNARELSPDTVPVKFSLAVADLSFISQTYVISPIASVLEECGAYVGLIKPQFECGREALGKGGIVKDKKHYASAVKRVFDSLTENGFSVIGLIISPIKGGDGNREFLFHAVLDGLGRICVPDERIKAIISEK